MSIFDVLRYNVSMPPTLEELEALPPTIYQEWVQNTDIFFNTEYTDVADVCYRIVYNHKYYPGSFCFPSNSYSALLNSVSLLKKMLYEHQSAN